MKKICVLLMVLSLHASPVLAEKLPMTLVSLDLVHEGSFPEQYSCHQTMLNPPLIISNVPEQAKSLVLMMHDEDAYEGPWAHWVAYNIPPTVQLIKSGDRVGTPAINDFGEEFYHAPCPPDGRPHQFVFTVYALNKTLYGVEGYTRKDLLSAIRGKVIAKAELVGIYENPKW